MNGLFPLVFSRTSCPVSSSVLSMSDSGYQNAQVSLGWCFFVILTSSALFTISDSCSSDRRSDSPLASTSVRTSTCQSIKRMGQGIESFSVTKGQELFPSQLQQAEKVQIKSGYRRNSSHHLPDTLRACG